MNAKLNMFQNNISLAHVSGESSDWHNVDWIMLVPLRIPLKNEMELLFHQVKWNEHSMVFSDN